MNDRLPSLEWDNEQHNGLDYAGGRELIEEVKRMRSRVEMLEGVLADAGIRYCRVCGCSDDYACDGGCEWVEIDLCSACVGEPSH